MSILLVRSVGASSGNSVLWVVVYLYFRFNKTVDVICYGVIWLNTDLHNAIQYNTIQCDTIIKRNVHTRVLVQLHHQSLLRS